MSSEPGSPEKPILVEAERENLPISVASVEGELDVPDETDHFDSPNALIEK